MQVYGQQSSRPATPLFQTYEGSESLKQQNIPPEDSADKGQKEKTGSSAMSQPLMTSTPRSTVSQKYAKPVMVPHDMQTTGKPFPKTVDILVIGGFQVDSTDHKGRVFSGFCLVTLALGQRAYVHGVVSAVCPSPGLHKFHIGLCSEILTHYQTTNFRLLQTERLCRRQFQI